MNQYQRQFSEDEIDRMIEEHNQNKNAQISQLGRVIRAGMRQMGYNGPDCPVCGHPTRPAGGKFICDNCGHS